MSACLTRSVGLESSLRRTMSADMSSEKWISTSGLRKVASVDRLCDDDTESKKAFEETWRSIQSEEEKEEPRLQSSDIWSSILSQKKTDEEEGKNAPPPYVHPLVKRSASTLSEKSLEICTESLGSETGSDGFDKTEVVEEVTETEDDVDEVVLFAAPVMAPQQSLKKVTSVRCFPPPLAHRGDGSNVQMRSHREDGRLVLEAVSVPTHACFKAERQDGRLLLSFSPASEAESEEDEDEVLFEEFQKVGDVVEDDENENQESDSEEEYEQVLIMNKDELVGANKFLDLTRSFPRRVNRVVKSVEDDDEVDGEEAYNMEVGHALNTYVYGWRSKVGPAVVAQLKEERGINKLLQVDHHSTVVEVVVDAKNAGEDDLIPMFLKGCNLQQQQPKLSKLVMWDHRCIAT